MDLAAASLDSLRIFPLGSSKREANRPLRTASIEDDTSHCSKLLSVRRSSAVAGAAARRLFMSAVIDKTLPEAKKHHTEKKGARGSLGRMCYREQEAEQESKVAFEFAPLNFRL